MASKRLYSSAFVKPRSTSALRVSLADHAKLDPPGRWRRDAVAAGVSGVDAFLCHLGRTIVDGLQRVSETSEAARAKLRSARAAILFAVNSRFDDLEARIAATETSKVANLESELCTVDRVLELLRAERGAAADAATSMDDIDLIATHHELVDRIGAAWGQMRTLPTAIVEPPFVGLITDASAILASIESFGQVIAPRAIKAADLTIEDVPRYVQPGRPMRVHLRVQGAYHASQSAEELEVSLQAVAAAVIADVYVHFFPPMNDSDLQPETNVSIDIPGRGLQISFDVPLSNTRDASLSIWPIVRGQAIENASLTDILVRNSMQVPLLLSLSSRHDVPSSLCISSKCHVFIPQGGSPKVIVFDYNGARLSSAPAARLGLNRETHWTAFADSDGFVNRTTLLLAGDDDVSPNPNLSRIIAVDPMTYAVRWATSPGLLLGCGGLAVLHHHRIVVAASISDGALSSYRLSNGRRVGRCSVPMLGKYLAAEPERGLIFGTVRTHDQRSLYSVVGFLWNPNEGFKILGIIAPAGARAHGRPLAVVPPAPGKKVSHLVVGALRTAELLVISLPDLALVHTHALEGIEVTALAADPWGEVLAVSDHVTSTVRVVAWPLPGMPALT